MGVREGEREKEGKGVEGLGKEGRAHIVNCFPAYVDRVNQSVSNSNTFEVDW